MFDTEITRTAFTTQAANQYFNDRIMGSSWGNDYTFLSTLRALLYSRVPEGQTASVMFYDFTYSQNAFDRLTSEEWITRIRGNYTDTYGTITVINISCDKSETDDRFLHLIEQRFCSDGKWVRLSPVTDFFRRNFEVMCFVNPEIRASVFFVKRMTRKILHQLQVASLTALPWYFNPKNGDRLTDEERELLESLQEKNHNHYLECLRKIASHLNFEEEFLRKSFRDIETSYERNRLVELTDNIEDMMRRIRAYEEEIGNVMREISRKNMEVLGLQTKINSTGDDSPMLDFFLNNRNIRLDKVRGTKILYHINTYLSSWDESSAENLIGNVNSVLYQYCRHIPKEIAKKVAKALFLDDVVRLRFCAAYQIDTAGDVRGMDGYSFNEDEYDRMPNPHIQYYACTGGYRASFNEALRNRDFIGVISQTMASASNINLADGVVMSRFFESLWNEANKKWFEFPDGRQVNLRELVEYLNEKEKEEKENEQDS